MAANWSWGSYLLPFLDQAPLFESLEIGNESLGATLLNPTKLELMRTPMTGFRCPSDVAPDINSGHQALDNTGTSHSLATSNFVGVNSGGDWTNLTDLRGIFGVNSAVRFRDITDGTSNTLVVGERNWRTSSAGGTAECNAAMVFGVGSSGSSRVVRMALAKGQFPINATQFDVTNTNLFADECARGFSSQHTGGAQFLLCDGSVRFVSENIEFDPDHTDANSNFIFQNLLNKSDGNVLGEF